MSHQTAKYSHLDQPVQPHVTPAPHVMSRLIGINADRAAKVQLTAEENINKQIAMIAAMPQAFREMSYAICMHLIDSPGWTQVQRDKWMNELEKAAFTMEELAMFNRIAPVHRWLSAATVESHPQPDGTDQAEIHTIGQHMEGDSL